MKQVTIDTVRERIAELDCLDQAGVISLRGGFELACLRELVAVWITAAATESAAYNIGDATMRHIFTPTGMTDVSDMQAVFDRVETVLARMEQPAPVSVPDDEQCKPHQVMAVKGELGFIDHFDRIISERDEDIDIGQLGSSNYEALMLASLDAFRAAMLHGAEHVPATDNTATADELRAQGVDIMKAKTLQSMQRSRSSFDAETWAVAEQCLLGLVDGCEVVANELRTGKLPERFRPQPDDTAPQQFEALATSAGSGKQ